MIFAATPACGVFCDAAMQDAGVADAEAAWAGQRKSHLAAIKSLMKMIDDVWDRERASRRAYVTAHGDYPPPEFRAHFARAAGRIEEEISRYARDVIATSAENGFLTVRPIEQHEWRIGRLRVIDEALAS